LNSSDWKKNPDVARIIDKSTVHSIQLVDLLTLEDCKEVDWR
jgi:hypothetical protein